MPSKSLRFCNHPGCNKLTDQRYCPEHMADFEAKQKEVKVQHEERRQTSSERGYDGRWRKARLTYLKHHPLCAECERQGKLTPATVVDHIEPHKGDGKKFWDKDNWQSLCKPCHDRKTAKEDGRWG